MCTKEQLSLIHIQMCIRDRSTIVKALMLVIYVMFQVISKEQRCSRALPIFEKNIFVVTFVLLLYWYRQVQFIGFQIISTKQKLLESALAINHKQYGPDFIRVANILLLLGKVYWIVGYHQNQRMKCYNNLYLYLKNNMLVITLVLLFYWNRWVQFVGLEMIRSKQQSEE